MNQSIKKIFDHIQLLLIVAVVFSTVILFISLSNNSTFVKLKNLQNQKEIIYSLVNLDKKDNTALNITLENFIKQLDADTEKLFSLYEYSFIESFSADNSTEYTNDLEKLKELLKNLTEASIEYYNLNPDNKNELKKSASYMYRHINSMIFKDFKYNEQKNNMYKIIIWITFFITLIVSVWLKMKLMIMFKNLDKASSSEPIKLNQKEEKDNTYTAPIKLHKEKNNTYTAPIKLDTKEDSTNIAPSTLNVEKDLDKKENNAISKSIEKKPSLMDQVTGLKNYHGMIACYKDKKDTQDFISVTELEIDNFSKLDHEYSHDVIETTVKEIASILSLHTQDSDIIAKTGSIQFTIILYRPSESESFNDINTIHKDISKIKISNNELHNINVSINAGFMIKHKFLNIDEALKQTNKLMLLSRQKGGNMISQIKDLIKDDLFKLVKVS